MGCKVDWKYKKISFWIWGSPPPPASPARCHSIAGNHCWPSQISSSVNTPHARYSKDPSWAPLPAIAAAFPLSFGRRSVNWQGKSWVPFWWLVSWGWFPCSCRLGDCLGCSLCSPLMLPFSGRTLATYQLLWIVRAKFGFIFEGIT